MTTTVSPSSQSLMPELSCVLQRLGLTVYSNVLAENGFGTWDTVLDITEDDLTALGFKLGHRRALQREIATYRGVPSSLALESDSSPDEQKPLSPASQTTQAATTRMTPPLREKRRYRRHPRPDTNAPKKPKTAYVNFADDLRASPEISALSFVDIAREVGRRWQELPPEKKRAWESNAARAMQEYEAQMDEYKKTENWRKYQAYLAEFRNQQQATVNGTRPTSARTDSFIRRESPRASPPAREGSLIRRESSHASPPARTDSFIRRESPRASPPAREGSLIRRASSRASPSASSESPISNHSSRSTSSEAEHCHNALTLAFSELVLLRGEILGQWVRPYDEQRPPPEQLVRRAMYAFVQGTGSLLYMWTYSEVDEILDRIYRPHHPVDVMTLAECFTVAALGAHYDMDCFPDRIRKILYASGTLWFNEKTAGFDYLRTMRLLLSMAFYALLEKHLSARYLVAAGLQIARWKCRAWMSPQAEGVSESWRRVYRSLIFVDSWLSYTLGYSPEVTSSDVSVACSAYRLGIATIEEQIHTQTSKVGLIAAEISKTLASPELATRENMAMLTGKLQSWRMGMPPMLQIPALTSGNPPNLTLYQRRAILMVHIMYLGALILLYRQLLVAAAEMQLTDGAAWSPSISVEDAQRYRSECAMAGQQIAQILQIISYDGILTKRCWLIIYWAFTACIVLLFSATNKLLEGQTDGVEPDLAYGKGCLDTLEMSRSFEPIAARYLDTLWPLYDALRDIRHRMVGRAKTSISSLLQADPNLLSPPLPVSKTEMGPISEKLSVLLTDPFGRKQDTFRDGTMRRVLNADGSCSVFWWK